MVSLNTATNWQFKFFRCKQDYKEKWLPGAGRVAGSRRWCLLFYINPWQVEVSTKFRESFGPYYGIFGSDYLCFATFIWPVFIYLCTHKLPNISRYFVDSFTNKTAAQTMDSVTFLSVKSIPVRLFEGGQRLSELITRSELLLTLLHATMTLCSLIKCSAKFKSKMRLS